MKDVFRVHEAARVKAGPLAGLVGTVQEVHPGVSGGWFTLRVQGLRDGESVDETKKLKASELARNK